MTGGADPAKAHVEELIACCRTLTTPKAKRNMAAIAATPEGRERVETALATLQSWQPAIAQASREMAKAVPVLIKALRSTRGKVRA